jgi:hypothetical protein
LHAALLASRVIWVILPGQRILALVAERCLLGPNAGG